MQVMFTGNRIQKFDSDVQREDAYYHLKRLIQHTIKRADEWGHKEINFISGMAVGVDTAACEFVLAEKLESHPIKISIIAAVPCINQDIRWRQEDRIRYKDLLSKCDDIHYVSKLNYHQSGGAKCLNDRNGWMISQLTRSQDMAIAIHNGKPGGTQNAIGDLIRVNKRIITYNYLLKKYVKSGSW